MKSGWNFGRLLWPEAIYCWFFGHDLIYGAREKLCWRCNKYWPTKDEPQTDSAEADNL